MFRFRIDHEERQRLRGSWVKLWPCACRGEALQLNITAFLKTFNIFVFMRMNGEQIQFQTKLGVDKKIKAKLSQ